MNRLEFDRIVAELEMRYRGRTRALRVRAVILAVVGYLMILFTGVFALGVLVLGVFALRVPKFGILMIAWGGAMIWGLSKSLWVRLGEAEGIELTPMMAPKLFRQIDAVAEAAGGVRLNRVVLTDDFNAAVQMTPRLGIFGWHKRTLVIGLPLLDTLSPEEFKSVLAHEFGHLGGEHGRMGNWVCRIRTTWAAIAESVAQSASFLLTPFLRWFWPRFNATAFLLSRHCEYEADAFAARYTSPRATGDALLRSAVAGRHLSDGFWLDVDRSLRRESEAPKDVFHRMLRHLRAGPPEDLRRQWTSHALAMATGTSDTHPALRDRLEAIGVTPGEPGPVTESATEAFLHPKDEQALRAEFDRRWHTHVAATWKERHAKTREFVAWEAGADTEPAPTEAVLWHRVEAVFAVEGIEGAQFWVERLLRLNPEHAGANFLRGSWLAGRDDAACLPLLEIARRDISFAEAALGALADYHARLGDREAVREMKRLADARDTRQADIEAELRALTAKSPLAPHDYAPEKLAALLATVSVYPEIKKVAFVRRPLKAWPEKNVYVLTVQIRFRWWKIVSESDYAKVLNAVVEGLPSNDDLIQVILNDAKNKAVAGAVEKVPSAVILTRK